ncbi:Transcription repressor OFP12 [Spatholobus suberectus]|nr:Transcription repressor OFP12 [Spatholobus suberectus]
MPSLFSKHLHLCFFKLKYPTILCQPHPPPPSTDTFPFTNHSSTEPDFASIFASQRFFFSSPGTSNSIVESPDTRTFIPTGGGVTVPKYSLNPYLDFLRSMQEMIRSRQVLDVTKDSEYLHELLLCYLALNPSHTHEYILRAFTDLLLQLLSSATTCRRHDNHRRHRSFSWRQKKEEKRAVISWNYCVTLVAMGIVGDKHGFMIEKLDLMKMFIFCFIPIEIFEVDPFTYVQSLISQAQDMHIRVGKKLVEKTK